jgi:NitT/TauT family transport system substrate-binding protein
MIIRVIVLLVSVTIFMTGCHQKEEPPVRLALAEWAGYAPWYIADAKGWLPNNVRVVDFASNYDIKEGIKFGTNNVAALTLDEAITQRQEAPLRVHYFLDFSNGADKVMAADAFPDLRALRGHRIAYEPDSVQAYLLTRALSLNGLGFDDITAVPLKGHDLLSAWQKGEIDAVSVYEPLATRLKKMGMHSVFDSGEIPGEIIDTLVVREPYAKQIPATLHALIRAWNRGVAALENDPEALQLVAKRLHLSVAELKTIFSQIKLMTCKENMEMAHNGAKHFTQIVQTVSTTLLEQKWLHSEATPYELLELTTLQGACEEESAQ